MARIDLFPTPLWCVDLQDLPEVLTAFDDAVETRQRADPAGVARTNRSGWQSGADLHRTEGLTDATTILAFRVAQTVADDVGLTGEDRLTVSSMWANVNGDDAWNVPHHHAPGPALSAVLYLRCPADSGPVTFHDPRPQASVGTPLGNPSAPLLRPRHSVRPERGDLLVFPSWLLHDVAPGAGPRISVACNLGIGPR